VKNRIICLVNKNVWKKKNQNSSHDGNLLLVDLLDSPLLLGTLGVFDPPVLFDLINYEKKIIKYAMKQDIFLTQSCRNIIQKH
jgi:hypothetical protein